MTSQMDEACTTTFCDVEKMLYQMCWKFAKRFGLDFDELVGVGHLAFMQTYKGFDPTRGCQFSSHFYNNLRHALLDFLTAEQLSKQRYQVNDELTCGVPDTHTHRLQNILAGLSDDARTIVMAVVESPGELAEVLRCKRQDKLRRGLWQHFKALGWSMGRTEECFAEIRCALN
jgi:DNA-directed RNA polymerase specialized sigma24 family protein